MKLAIEQAILSTLLNPSHGLDEDFDKIIEYKLDYKLFTANRTHSLVAKAIYNHIEDNDIYDELLIHHYINTKIKDDVNNFEFLEINNKTSLHFPVFLKYIETLKEIEATKVISDRLKRL